MTLIKKDVLTMDGSSKAALRVRILMSADSVPKKIIYFIEEPRKKCPEVQERVKKSGCDNKCNDGHCRQTK